MGQAFSNLMKNIAEGKFVYTGELEAHRSTDLSEVIQWAKTLKATGKIVAANVTDNPQSVGALSSLVTSYIVQRETGLETVYQLRCSDRNRLALASDLLGAAALGLKNVLALTGDHPKKGDTPEAMPVFDLDGTQLVELIHKMVYEGRDLSGNEIHGPRPQFNIGAAANPNFKPLEAEVLKLERKAEVGADFFQTQVVFDVNVALEFLDAVSHIKAAFLIGIFPPRSYNQAEYFAKNVPGVQVPKDFLESFKKISELPDKTERRRKIDEYNIEYFADFIKQVKKKPVCKGIHVMAVGYPEVVNPIIEKVEKG
ncbi:MAG: methylenetetrahydrofolate reductase [Candidatus Bathyarchaeota archaeon]|nr:methylenetetrahydrofolate reductase [Candidatus Bathyarchaeota archaeon]MCX8177071.1 methylenetetrahydrofolate reductase [Candidatus Bathyarchaeota archaeon]MDW8194190.1 methylenetetrahydrofolate reductase [Nitrososphaerota archaeon]